MISKRSVLLLLAISWSIIFSGCWDRNIRVPRTVPVQGRVLWRGKPLSGVRVTFHPQFDTGRVAFLPTGWTDANGYFTLSTARIGDGAMPGDYVVTFEWIQVSHDRLGLEIEVDVWKGKYASVETSPWRVTVSSDSQQFDFQLN